MRRFAGLLLVFFLFGFASSLQGQVLIDELRNLRNLKRTSQITTEQFFLLFDNLINKYSGGTAPGSTTSPNDKPHKRRYPRPVQPTTTEDDQGANEANDPGGDDDLHGIIPSTVSGGLNQSTNPSSPTAQGFKVTMKILAIRYWRAKKLVELIPSIEFLCDGQGVSGKVTKSTPDDIRFLFPLRLTPGMHAFEVVYTAKMRKTLGDSPSAWETKTYRFPFGVDIQKDCNVTKVIDFIEKRGLFDSKGEANIMDITVYNQLLAERKKTDPEPSSTTEPTANEEE